MTAPLPIRLVLPSDARIPTQRLDGRATDGDAPWQTPYQSRFVTIAGDRDARNPGLRVLSRAPSSCAGGRTDLLRGAL